MFRSKCKAVARLVPAIDRVIKQRDELIREIEQLRVAINKLVIADRPQIKPMVDRFKALTQHLNLDGIGLEVGPSYSPLLPKSAGYHIETIDYVDANYLREKFRNTEVDISRIEDVDYISGGGSIFETIRKLGRYDYIIASHVAEHFPDFLGFLNDCALLLKPEGRLSLAVPDKRYCFDLFQALTTTGQVLQAHYDNVRRPGPGTQFDFVSNYAMRGAQIAWRHNDLMPPHFLHDLHAAKAAFDCVRSSEEYLDAHVWRFVPSSFRLILHDLNALGETSMREFSFIETGEVEFFVTLSREGSGCQLDRLSLAMKILKEQTEIAFA